MRDEPPLRVHGMDLEQLLIGPDALVSPLLERFSELRWYPRFKGEPELLDHLVWRIGDDVHLFMLVRVDGDELLLVPARISRRGSAGSIPLELDPLTVFVSGSDTDAAFIEQAMGGKLVGLVPGRGLMPVSRPVLHTLECGSTNKLLVLEGGERPLLLKSFRSFGDRSREPEVLERLHERGFHDCPVPMGQLNVDIHGRVGTFINVTGLVRGRESAWDRLVRDRGGWSDEAKTLMGALGRTTARMHLALLSGAVEIDEAVVTRWKAAATRNLSVVEHLLPEGLSRHIVTAFDGMRMAVGSHACITHEDLHLGQFLLADRGPVILDFEGEPVVRGAPMLRSLPPARDVATMLRSFDYLVCQHFPEDPSTVAGPAARMRSVAERTFLSGYREALGEKAAPVCLDPQLLRAFQVERALKEVLYESRYRSEWLRIPVEGLVRLVGVGSAM